MRSLVTKSLAVSLFCVGSVLCSQVAMAQSPTLSFYIAPNGNDANSGDSADSPIHTLDRAQALVEALPPSGSAVMVDLLFMPGTYDYVAAEWKSSRLDMTVRLKPAQGKKGGTVIFDGSKAIGRAFFKFDPSLASDPNTAATMHFLFDGLVVKNYCEAISIGDVKGRFKTAGHSVENSKFFGIGSKYDTRQRKATSGKILPSGDCVAAIRLSASGESKVVGNIFENIENLPSGQTYYRKYGPSLLHAIYIATGASDNVIENNRFVSFTGSPIRIRDRSNGTSVIGNDFSKPLYPLGFTEERRLYAISEWYCNDAVAICLEMAKQGVRECPSEGTKISGNRIESSDLNLFANQSQSRRSTCDIQ
jgi:hypothetical protein